MIKNNILAQSWLPLALTERLRGMLLLDDSGMVVGREIGPHSEGHRLSITCRTVFGE